MRTPVGYTPVVASQARTAECHAPFILHGGTERGRERAGGGNGGGNGQFVQGVDWIGERDEDGSGGEMHTGKWDVGGGGLIICMGRCISSNRTTMPYHVALAENGIA